MSEQPRYQSISSVIPVTNEQLIDMGHGTPEMIEADQRRRAEIQRWRRSWRGRWRRFTIALHFYGPRERLRHAWAALRGIECDRW